MSRILIVDDNAVNCDMLADVLSEWGYEVRQAYQGREVLPLLATFRPQLVLLDVMLPGMNGFEICKRIKEDPATENIAVILLTVLGDVEDRTQGIHVGADLFLSKPVNYKELRRQIESVLAKKRKLMDMESSQSVCQCLENAIACLDAAAYAAALETKDYCRRAARLLALPAETAAQAEMAAVFCAFGQLLAPSDGQAALRLLAPLHLTEWLRPYLLAEEAGNPGVALLCRVSRFCARRRETDDPVAALQALRVEYGEDAILAALRQTIEDERFLEQLRL